MDSKVEKIAGAGSNRAYYRITEGGSTVIRVEGTSAEENAAFIYLTNHFTEKGLNVPRIINVSNDGLSYTQTDLGRTSLFDAVAQGRKAGRYSEDEQALLESAIRYLPKLQVTGAEDLDFSKCYPQAAFNEDTVLFDLYYFKYCFLMPSGTDFNEVKLQDDFRAMAHGLTAEGTRTFMYRDFQPRNIMMVGGEPFFIDYQGGRRGPFYYDVASFVWQASARYDEELRKRLVDAYYEAMAKVCDMPAREIFDRRLRLFVLFRTLQVLGAYGYRGNFERKAHFLNSIPAAIDNLSTLLPFVPYPYLRDVLTRLVNTSSVGAGLCPRPQYQEKPDKRNKNVVALCGRGQSPAPTPDSPALTIRIFSFSYKKGIPDDETGNGGGYVFDCRGTNNPGRYDEYKSLTGMDEPVKRFLEDDGEITTFLTSVYALADKHIERYIARHFTALMFAFGCTGGQHRSVYCAEHLARHLHEKYNVEVRITHREQGVESILKPTIRQAMILAAGLGTRLKPLTDSRPKALVEVAGKTLLEHTLDRIKSERVVVNIHHFADMMRQAIATLNRGIIIADESERLLDTGGAIRAAATHFDKRHPVLVHNVDIFSNADLESLYAEGYHHNAVLLVSERQTTRYLLFDDDMHLRGWQNSATGETRYVNEELRMKNEELRRYAFSGIHVINTQLIERMETWGEAFSIIDFYLSEAGTADIRGLLAPDLHLLDVGKVDTLDKVIKHNNI